MKKVIISSLAFIFLLLILLPERVYSTTGYNAPGMVMALKPFKGINVKGNIRVIIVPGSFHGIKVLTDNEDAHGIQPRIAHRSLYLVRKKQRNTHPITVYISCTDIKVIETFGAAIVMNEGLIKAKNIYLYVHESGEIHLNLDVEKVAANVAKNGTIILGGHFGESAINVKGTGKVRLKNTEG